MWDLITLPLQIAETMLNIVGSVVSFLLQSFLAFIIGIAMLVVSTFCAVFLFALVSVIIKG